MFPVIADPSTPFEYFGELLEEYWVLALIIVCAAALAIALIVKLGKKKKK